MDYITRDEMVQLFAVYFDPLYKLAGGLMAVTLFVIIYWLLIRPFIKRIAR